MREDPLCPECGYPASTHLSIVKNGVRENEFSHPCVFSLAIDAAVEESGIRAHIAQIESTRDWLSRLLAYAHKQNAAAAEPLWPADGLFERQILAALDEWRAQAARKDTDEYEREPMTIGEILAEIEQAYPLDIFPDTTQGERDDVIERYPGFIDRTSAMMGRHLAKVIRQKLQGTK